MAKKKIGERKANPALLNAFQGARVDKAPQGQDNLADVADWAMKSMTDEQKGQFVMMYTLASSGVTPDDYAQFYHIFQATGALAEDFMSGTDDDDDFPPSMGRGFGRGRCDVKEYAPLEDAATRSLVLKIQMKDVTKPPMWREVEIPADFNFQQLHEVIQEVTGLEDEHLWQFNVKAYDDDLLIGMKMDPNSFSPGLDFVTHEAEETVVSRFLHQKGDKLEYVYDFGDDWIFVIEVKDVIEKKNEHPVCRKYKSELNAIENFGGVWAYEETRIDLEKWGRLSKKERKERLERYGFETEQEYLEFLNEHRMNLDDVNDALGYI